MEDKDFMGRIKIFDFLDLAYNFFRDQEKIYKDIYPNMMSPEQAVEILNDNRCLSLSDFLGEKVNKDLLPDPIAFVYSGIE